MDVGSADGAVVRVTVMHFPFDVVVSPPFQGLWFPRICAFGMIPPLCCRLPFSWQKDLDVNFLLRLGLPLPGQYEFLG